MTEPVWDCVVIGSQLAGLVAAARLAKLRHRVLVVANSPTVGGDLAPYPLANQHEPELVDDWPVMFTFPAPWRDLFRKSGRSFDEELARYDQALVPAPATTHVFADTVSGRSSLTLPSERGVQYSVLSQAYGASVANQWRDLLDRLDEVAQELRPLGGEGELTSYRQIKAAKKILQPSQSVTDLARSVKHPHLSALITSTAWRIGSRPERTPAWCATSLAAERRFGRWMMTTADQPDRASTLLDRLQQRLTERRVTLDLDQNLTSVRRCDDLLELTLTSVDHHDESVRRARSMVVAEDPHHTYPLLDSAAAGEWRRFRRAEPALRPTVSHTIHEPGGDHGEHEYGDTAEIIRHSDQGPVITWHRPIGGGRILASRHDWTTAQPDRQSGLAWRGPRSVMQRPPIRSAAAHTYLAGPWSAGGAVLSQVVLSGALAAYACHEGLTGDRVNPWDERPR